MRRWLKRRVRDTRELLHGATISRWHWYPADLPAFLAPRQQSAQTGKPRVAYFIWHFPVLSQTFIRREITALRKHGLSIEVFAEEPEDVDLLDDRDRGLIETTRYLLPVDEQRLERYKRELRAERPLLYRHVYLYIMSRRYGLSKKLGRDRALFEQAVYLAGSFREAGIDRVHSPWGDRAGFAAMLAAKLLGLPFSLQVRAHDLHDPSYHPALREMLREADFVITNTLYNRPFIGALKKDEDDVHTIYNGIDLTDFNPPERVSRAGQPARILCVARLVEQKGLTDLLDACALLRERGLSFTCDIIGGPEEPLYKAYWLRLQRKHAALGLEDTVFFRGALPFRAVMSAYRDADVFVLPCVVAKDGRRDVTPNAIIEAMAMKLPVVSTPVAGVGEIIEDGVSGVLIPVEDPRALADQIERITSDDALSRRLGDNARARIEARFDADNNVAARMQLFAAVHSDHERQRVEPGAQMSWQES
jgi:glycosyltransferase involved in cell wall biosynthesis